MAGTPIQVPFDLSAPLYLDPRQYIETFDELNNIDLSLLPHGFKMYCEEKKQWYKYDYNKDGVLELMEDNGGEKTINETPKTTQELDDILNAIIDNSSSINTPSDNTSSSTDNTTTNGGGN